MMRCLIIGCGYLGRRVADRWKAAGHDVSALTRSASKAEALRADRITPVVGDVTDGASLADLPRSDVVLYAVGYDRASGDRRSAVVGGIENVLSALRGKTERLVFVSTTSVYGQSSGEWVDEQSPTEPITEAGRIALAVETHVRSTQGFTSLLLRMSGLYGPGRLLRRAEEMRSRTPIAGNGDAWLNLVHVDDAASAVECATSRLCDSTPRGGTYLVTDDQPVRRRDYYERLATLTDSPPPTFDPTIDSRITGIGKRCRNELAKRELGWSLAFPTYAVGLERTIGKSETPISRQ